MPVCSRGAPAGADPLAPRPTAAFLEYSQVRGFLVDSARPRHPRDKPHVERGVPYVRERFWKGGSFRDLADARRQAERWCLEVAGIRPEELAPLTIGVQRVMEMSAANRAVVTDAMAPVLLVQPPRRPDRGS